MRKVDRRLVTIIAGLAVVSLIVISSMAIAREEGMSGKNAVKDERRFAPSYVSIEGHKDVTPEQWTDPRICGQCHSAQYEGWNGSMHSNAFKDPVYQALWALAEKADPSMHNHCGTCHTPIGITTKTVEFHPDEGCTASSRRHRLPRRVFPAMCATRSREPTCRKPRYSSMAMRRSSCRRATPSARP